MSVDGLIKDLSRRGDPPGSPLEIPISVTYSPSISKPSHQVSGETSLLPSLPSPSPTASSQPFPGQPSPPISALSCHSSHNPGEPS